MAIYTRAGDKGKTSLFDGRKVLKSDIQVEAYGTIDELNSAIGSAAAFIKDKKIINELRNIQNDLLEIGSSLAVTSPLPVDQIANRPSEFENLIDSLTKKMPVLSEFILPGGGRAGSLLHLARTVARRAERRVVLLSKKEDVDSTVLIYLNRLSDLLFTMARFINYKEKHKETTWKKR